MIEFLVAGLFSDHMVLQQKQANPVWGWDQPGQVVRLTVESTEVKPVTVEVTADAQGRWRLLCPVLPAGGPYTLRVQGSSEQVIQDVLVGEVWLASGQSNMAWTLGATTEGPEESAKADKPSIRSIKISNVASREPQTVIGGSWTVCSPSTVGGYSAIAWHHASRLHETLGVPVGIIDASWGGSRLEAWVRPEGLAQVMDLKGELAALDADWAALPARRAAFNVKQSEWDARVYPADPGNTGEGLGWASPDFNDSHWKSLSIPCAWDQHGLGGPGAMWLRRELVVPAAWEGQDLSLDLGTIDDFDTTYFNGQPVGSTPAGTARAATLRRSYVIPAKLVQAGRAVIAVRVFDHNGGGGLTGPGPVMGLSCPSLPESPRVRLAGEWRANREASVTLGEIDWSTNPWPDFPEEQYWPSSIWNGMMAPIAGYGIRGALWYQGETNCDTAPAAYGDRLCALVRDWRAAWGQGEFPVLVVQLPEFKANDGWPVVREGQESVLRLARTSLLTSLGQGNPADIHPRAKRVLGRRLGDLALHEVYGLELGEVQGPVHTGVDIAGGRAVVHFAHAAGLRTLEGSAKVLGFELVGADGVWHAAQARIDGETVIVECAEVPAPCSLRYAWDSSPVVNLVNAVGLPARPFRM